MDNLIGKFITFEGGDGTGKTTQSKKLVEYLNSNGIKAIWTREPGGTPIAEQIRNILLNSKENIDSDTEILLMLSARIHHVNNFIKPLLNKKVTVVCDRFSDSTIAYQGFGRGYPLDKIEQLNKILLEDFKPDITFVFDNKPETALLQVTNPNNFENSGLDFHKRVREGFLYVLNQDRCIKISCDNYKKDINSVFNEILNHLIVKFNNN